MRRSQHGRWTFRFLCHEYRLGLFLFAHRLPRGHSDRVETARWLRGLLKGRVPIDNGQYRSRNHRRAVRQFLHHA